MMCSFFCFFFSFTGYYIFSLRSTKPVSCLVNAIREKSTFAESLSEFSRSIPALKMGIG